MKIRLRLAKDEAYLQIAAVMAQRGTCIRRQVGCVLVDKEGFILATGYNGVAAGRRHCITNPCPGAEASSGERLDECEAIHAEQNAILRLSDPRKVYSAYCTTSPCISCVKLLLGTSCQRIVFKELYAHPQSEIWWKEAGREWWQLNPDPQPRPYK
jgi:dCMP deaminase